MSGIIDLNVIRKVKRIEEIERQLDNNKIQPSLVKYQHNNIQIVIITPPEILAELMKLEMDVKDIHKYIKSIYEHILIKNEMEKLFIVRKDKLDFICDYYMSENENDKTIVEITIVSLSKNLKIYEV